MDSIAFEFRRKGVISGLPHHPHHQMQPLEKQEQENAMTPKTQEFKLHGDSVISKLKEILHEGDIRRITIKNDEGHTLIEIPLTLGVVGALLLPVWAAIGAIAALAASLTIVVERTDVRPPVTPDAPTTNPRDSV
jgi:Domain of unknown function (DUF4342)